MSGAAMLREHDLAAYVRHVERFGPECVIAAVHDLDERDLGELRAFIAYKERTHRFKRGEWVPRKEGPVRACDFCGLDLPPGASSRMRFHTHCKQAAARRRQAARTSPPAPGAAGDTDKAATPTHASDFAANRIARASERRAGINGHNASDHGLNGHNGNGRKPTRPVGDRSDGWDPDELAAAIIREFDAVEIGPDDEPLRGSAARPWRSTR